MKNYIILSILVCFMAACQKEIEFDYNTIDKIYVIEGNLTNESTQIYITTTRNMDEYQQKHVVNNAVVEITGDDGYTTRLQHDGDGYYRPISRLKGTAGTNYTLNVSIGDKEFVSESTMHEKLNIESVEFKKQELFGIKLMMCSISFMDKLGEDNFYIYRIYRNGEIHNWSAFTDKGHDGAAVTVNLRLMMQSEILADDPESVDYAFAEGDMVDVELQVITKSVYDYYYSLALSRSTSSNPINNFSGDCLGYFSAHPISRYSFVFSEDLEIQEMRDER